MDRRWPLVLLALAACVGRDDQPPRRDPVTAPDRAPAPVAPPPAAPRPDVPAEAETRRGVDGRCEPTPKEGDRCAPGDGYCVLSWGSPGGHSTALWCRGGRWEIEHEVNLPADRSP